MRPPPIKTFTGLAPYLAHMDAIFADELRALETELLADDVDVDVVQQVLAEQRAAWQHARIVLHRRLTAWWRDPLADTLVISAHDVMSGDAS